MTLEKLQRLYPSATSATWRQHVNADGSPGGWINNRSHVDATAVISNEYRNYIALAKYWMRLYASAGGRRGAK